MSYYLNLSILSNAHNNSHRIKKLSAKARRILSMCEGGPITKDDIARELTGRPFFRVAIRTSLAQRPVCNAPVT